VVPFKQSKPRIIKCLTLSYSKKRRRLTKVLLSYLINRND
jgi:hypothetical protein